MSEHPIDTRTIIKLIFASMFVGFILHSLDISPKDFWLGILDLISWFWTSATSFFNSGLIYLVTGALIVVPIFLLKRMLKARKHQSPGVNKQQG